VIKAVAPALTSPSTLAPEEVTMEELVSVEAAAAGARGCDRDRGGWTGAKRTSP